MRLLAFSLSAAWALLLFPLAAAAPAGDANRLAYLDEPCDPYYVGRDFAKLTTPQWIGEEGVEAVVVLAIDDMRDTAKYEAYLRPILDRLKKIDGRAPVSIMSCRVDPQDPQLAAWLEEGLSIEVHTYDHPCPLLKDGDFPKAKETYERCVDLMNEIPGNTPVAFRMPCCDSLNTPSPRFWTEIFNKTTRQKNFLALDSSVFNVFTPADPELPRELVTDADGERFRKYIPFPSFANTIENYPYPYVIAGRCWEFPCMVPSDWEAQHLQQPNNPRTVADMQAAIDATVVKQGVFNLVFHPHGWIRSDQIVQLIDHAVEKHGGKVKFLTFREAYDRINKNLLAGQPLRDEQGRDNGVRVLDANGDGYMDVVIGNKQLKQMRTWMPEEKRWETTGFPLAIANQGGTKRQAEFGILTENRESVVMLDASHYAHAWRFRDNAWHGDESLELGDFYSDPFADWGTRLRDLDGDGNCELIVSNVSVNWVYSYSSRDRRWNKVEYGLPDKCRVVTDLGHDTGLRLHDIDADGDLDALISNEQQFGLYLFQSIEKGWSETALKGRRGDAGAIPMIARGKTNNGAWFHSGKLWVQNEETSRLPDLVDRMAFRDMLKAAEKDEAQREEKLVPIGAAKVDITPDYPIRLSGYGSRASEATKAAQKIWAKAVAIGGDKKAGVDAAGPAVIVNVENCGVVASIVDEVAKRLKERHGVGRERLVVCSTHSHTAPQINGFAPFIFAAPLAPQEQKHIDRYTGELTEKIVEVVGKALAARRPGRLSWAVGKAAVAGNRRVLMDGRWTGFGNQADGPVDHSLPILAAHDAEGKLIAVVANYACHCTTLGGNFNEICGDWAGYAQEDIERDHPGALAMITIGCGADANPNPRGELEMSRAHGRTIAGEVARLLKGELTPVSPAIACRLDRIDLPLDRLPKNEQWQAQLKQGGQSAHHAQSFLDSLAKGEKLPTTVPYTISTWTLGDDLAMVFLAGEVVVDYAIRMKDEFDAERLWITAYANDVPCYIPSKRILREGGYEADRSMVYYGKPTRFAPPVEDLIVESVQRLLPPRFYSQAKQADYPPPLSPRAAIAAFELHDEMQIELVAAEPLIVDPVAFDWGPDGRLWVVEMRDYPNGLDGAGKPGGRVKVLTDDDGDGRYDRATLFLDGVPFPTGVKVWRDGILVTAAPEIFYAQDTDGDGRADLRKTLYRGFGEGNQQHRVNGLRWGLDNWLHVGNGDSGGEIKSLVAGEVINVSRRDLRIRPDEGLLEPTSGNTQFGRSRDDWGNWFGGNNSNPMWHYVLDDRYLARNRHVAPPDMRHHISVEPGAAPVYPASRTLTRFNDFNKANRFTSACSPIIYRDELLGPAFAGNSFVCEPVHNLVHREVVSTDGATFSSRRADDEQRSEFLASADNWCRPSMVRTGPDGALWVADMYRFVIEHPKWIPKDWQRRLDVRAGDDRGRIYRIYPKNTSPRPPARLDRLDAAELVAALESPNGWQRDMAQQMLLWAGDRVAAAPLEKLSAEGKLATARLHALCTLDGLAALSDDVLLTALRDKHPGVRRHAIRLSENRLDDSPQLFAAAIKLLDDPDAQIQLQLAYSLGAANTSQAARGLADILLAHLNSPYLTAAALSSINKNNVDTILTTLLRPTSAGEQPPGALVERLLSLAVALQGKTAVERVAGEIIQPTGGEFADWQFAAVAGMLDALARQRVAVDKPLTQQIAPLVSAARRQVASTDAPPQRRILAMRLLGRSADARQADVAMLGRLLDPRQPPEMQTAAARALASLREATVPKILLAGWRSHSPALRGQVLDVLLSRTDWTNELLAAVEGGSILAAHIDSARGQQLRSHRDASIRSRAEKLLAAASNADRQQVLADHQDVLTLSGDALRGKAMFAKKCSQCHRLENVGHQVGPDLTALSDKSPHSLLTAVLDPNRAVEDKFLEYVALTDDGRQLRGILAAETSTSITLNGLEGKQAVVLRGEIDELVTSGKSLMPDGMEKEVGKQGLADVIAYLRNFGPAPSRFAGNRPKLITAAANGSLQLLATNCRIYGSRLVFETKYSNLGWWSREDDRAVWSLELPRAGRYRIVLDYACHDDTAGNKFLLRAAGKQLVGQVAGTGTWDDYRQVEIGALDLPAGAAELEIRSAGRPKDALFDLRGVQLMRVEDR